MNKLQILASILVVCAAQLNIYVPQELKEQFGQKPINVNFANFGYIPYGRTLMGIIQRPILAQTQLMDTKLEGCQNLISPNITNYILIVKRGGCSFTTKGFFGEIAGASMVIIVDNLVEDVDNTIMMDDHSGHRVNIPVLMITNDDGVKILDYMTAKPDFNIMASIEFIRPNLTHQVNYEYWMSSLDYRSYDFIYNFIDIHMSLEKEVTFTPHYALWYCVACQESNYTENLDKSLCISNGRYCAPDPDGNGPFQGYHVVLEDIRQICIHQNSTKAWWEYTYQFRDDCLMEISQEESEVFYGVIGEQQLQQCSQRIIQEIGLNYNDIKQCVKNSFQGDDFQKAENQILLTERRKFEEQKVQIWPFLIVNGMGFRGDLDAQNPPWEFICEGFDIMPSPQCDRWNTTMINIENDTFENEQIGHFGTYFMVVVLVLAFILIVMYLYRRMIKQQMLQEVNFKVRESVSQYYAMNDNQKSFRAIRDQKKGSESL